MTAIAVFPDEGMHVVTPGQPELSALYLRLTMDDSPYRMHPYRSTVDPVGSDLIWTWIMEDSEEDCQAYLSEAQPAAADGSQQAEAQFAEQARAQAAQEQQTRALDAWIKGQAAAKAGSP